MAISALGARFVAVPGKKMARRASRLIRQCPDKVKTKVVKEFSIARTVLDFLCNHNPLECFSKALSNNKNFYG